MRSARLTAGVLGLVAMFSFAATSRVALAQEEEAEAPDYVRDGWYVGAQWNMGMPADDAVDNSQGLSAYVGWRFLKYWGMDFQYEWQNGFVTPTGPDVGESNAHVITLNTRAYLPLGRVQPFVLAGVGLFQTSKTAGGVHTAKGDFAGRLGGGVDFYLTKNWVLEGSATYVLPAGDQNDQRYLSIGAGLQYRFEPYIY